MLAEVGTSSWAAFRIAQLRDTSFEMVIAVVHVLRILGTGGTSARLGRVSRSGSLVNAVLLANYSHTLISLVEAVVPWLCILRSLALRTPYQHAFPLAYPSIESYLTCI